MRLASVLLIMLIFLGVPRAFASNNGAHLQAPKVGFRPAPAGQVELTATVGFTGGCCFTLTTYDIRASLATPQGVTVTAGPEPGRYDHIVGPPGGVNKNYATFRWRLKKSDPNAEYPLRIKISTRNSGEIEKDFLLGKTVSCALGEPEIAGVAAVGRKIPVKIMVTPGDEDKYIKDVTLFMVRDDVDPRAEELAAAPRALAKGELRFSARGEEVVKIGSPIHLSRKYEPTVWQGIVPGQTRGLLRIWVVATDSAGESTASELKRVQVVDFNRSRALLWATTSGMVLLTAAGLVGIFYRHRHGYPAGPGLWVLGAPCSSSRNEVFEAEGSCATIGRRGLMVLAAFFLLLLLFVYLSGMVGPLRELISLINGAGP